MILVALLTGCGNGAAEPLTTSGTTAATEVSVAAEIAGKVTDVLVEEGQKVDKGDPVARLADAAKLNLGRSHATGTPAGSPPGRAGCALFPSHSRTDRWTPA